MAHQGPQLPLSLKATKAAVEFSAAMVEFSRAVKGLFAGGSLGGKARLEFVDLNATLFQVELVTTGTSSAFPAAISSEGYARIPLVTFGRISRAIRMLRITEIKLRIEPGTIRVGTLVFSHPEISLRLIGSRIADLPIGAQLPDVLGILTRFRPEEIDDSGLLGRVLAAQEEASRLVDQAFKALGPLGIERAALSEFVSQQIAKRPRRKG